MKRAQFQTLCASLVAGALIGLGVHYFFLLSYRAIITMPLQGDVQLFRRSDELLRSVDSLQRFARARKVDGEAFYRNLERGLVPGGTIPVTFEHVFRLTRADTRDLPEPALREFVAQLAKEPNSKSDVSVTAFSTDPAEAALIAQFVAHFGRDVLLRVSLSDLLDQWRGDAAQKIATTKELIITLRTTITSLLRRIEDLDSVRAKYKVDAATDATAGEAGVQVQVSGARYLSPLQQIVGLEFERVDIAEQLRTAEESLLRFETNARLAAKMDALLKAEPDTAAALNHMEGELQVERARGEAGNAPNAEKVAIAELLRPLAGLRARFVDAFFSPPSPVVRRVGPRRLFVILSATGLAVAGWLFVMRALRQFKT